MEFSHSFANPLPADVGEDLLGKLSHNVGGFSILLSSSEILNVGGGFSTEIDH